MSRGLVLAQVGTETYRLEEGQALLIRPEEIHALRTDGQMPGRCFAIVFDWAFLHSATYDRLQRELFVPLHQNDCQLPRLLCGREPFEHAIIRRMLSMIEAYGNTGIARELTIKGNLYLILSELIERNQLFTGVPARSSEQLNMQRLKIVLQYIESHYTSCIRLKDVAQELNLSEGHFCRLFKSMMRKTFISYLHEYRVERAAHLLQESNQTVADIATEVGFEDLSYFIRVFKEIKGCTPARFRAVGVIPFAVNE